MPRPGRHSQQCGPLRTEEEQGSLPQPPLSVQEQGQRSSPLFVEPGRAQRRGKAGAPGAPGPELARQSQAGAPGAPGPGPAGQAPVRAG